MAVSQEQHRLLYRIAQAYYVDDLTQQQIAKRFGLSRPKVSRLLQKARDERIINVTLIPPTSGMADLERELEHKYGLEEVVIAPISDPQNHPLVVRELGPTAAECLIRCISGKEIVGTEWGTTILAMVDALPFRTWPNVTVVQMLGGLGPVGTLEHSTELAQRMAQKFGAKLRLLPAPGIVSSRAAAQELKSNSQISETLALAAKADIAVVGLGVPSPVSVLLRDGTIISPKELERFREAGAVGDIGLRYIDAYGKPLDLEINERIIGLSLEQIMNIPRVIGVAGGTVKYEVIRAALRGKILDVLVTDHVTAQALLAEASHGLDEGQ